jgi:CBS domain-containing protein
MELCVDNRLNTEQLPAVDNGRLSGIITLTDIINYIMENQVDSYVPVTILAVQYC